MAAPYLGELRAMIDTSLGALADEVTCKHFFSGAAAYVNDRIVASLSPVGLAFKLPEATCRALLEADAQPLRYFPTSPVKRGYVLFEQPSRLDPERISTLLIESIDHALGLTDEGESI